MAGVAGRAPPEQGAVFQFWLPLKVVDGEV